MNKYLRRIGLGIGALVLPCVIGCGRPPEGRDYIDGIVIKEGGTLVKQTSRQASNNCSQRDSDTEETYILTIKAFDGRVYTLNVTERSQKPRAVLEQAIEEGDHIRFVGAGYAKESDAGWMLCQGYSSINPADNTGNITSTFITLVRKAEKKKE